MYKLYIAILFFFIQTISAQQLRQPFDFPILLSGNFGELRNNHFHSGIDFKTQGVEGKPIHAVQDGYVSRISVSPWGYGNGLYLTHPDGTTTVYGHLQRFAPSIARYIKTQQYEQESFNVNLFLDPDQLPVKKGEIVAYSGNTGSSGGPHLHFEVRDTESEEVLDPIEYFKEKITDTRAPKIQGILVCPQPGKGVVNGSSRKLELKPVTAKNGKQTITGKIEAWGEIGLAVKAYDYMDNTTNIYGVKDITLRQDSQIIYHSNLDRFAFDETRYLNSYVDYEEWKERRSFYMRSFVEPGNRLRFNESINRGIIHIEEEKTYHLTYTLADAFGNTTRLSVWIEGKEQEIPEIETEGTELFHWMADNRFGAKGIRMTIPKGNLYDDLYFRYSVKEDSTALADTHILHNRPVRFTARPGCPCVYESTRWKTSSNMVSSALRKDVDPGSAALTGTAGSTARYKELGNYTVGQDLKAPTITPLGANTWISKQAFVFRLSDNLSGVQTYRGEIDGQYVLFEMNSKSVITYKFDKERLKKGKHTLKLTVTDAAGNRSEYKYSFVW